MYNAEKYIEKCLSTCLEQNVIKDDYEIIVINDGSKDNSLAVAETIARNSSNIEIYTQENRGLSAARNKGLDLAKGDFVWFIDSDDWIEEKCLSAVFQLLDNQIEILKIGAANVIGNSVEKRHTGNILGNEIMPGLFFLKEFKFSYCVPFSIFRKSFLQKHNLSFVEGIFHEDVEFTPRAYYFCEKIRCFDKILYYVFQNPNSITRTLNPKRAFDYIKVAALLYNFTINTVKDGDRYLFYDKITMMLNNSMSVAYACDTINIKEWQKDYINSSYLFDVMAKGRIRKYKIEGLIFQYIRPQIVLFAYKILFKKRY